MSTVFAKPVSENKSAASLLVIRIGMAFAFYGHTLLVVYWQGGTIDN